MQKKLRHRNRYRNLILVSVDDTETRFWSYTSIVIQCVHDRWLFRLEFQLPRPILSSDWATDKIWPFGQFHISYKNSEIRDQKCQFLTFKVNFLCKKSSKTFLMVISLKNIILGAHFMLLTFFETFNFWSTLSTKIRPIFVSWFPS